eukprot:1186641-Prorocentrum_minimum.AAC.5
MLCTATSSRCYILRPKSNRIKRPEAFIPADQMPMPPRKCYVLDIWTFESRQRGAIVLQGDVTSIENVQP